MATKITNWSMRVERVRRKAETCARAVVGTQQKVRLDKTTCFCGTVKSCTADVLEGPGLVARAIYTMTLVGPTGYEMTFKTCGR